MEIYVNLLKKSIEQYDKIFFTHHLDIYYKNLKLKVNRKVLVLSLQDVRLRAENVIFQQVTKFVSGQLLSLYFMYDFSDKFFLLSKQNFNYASLFNFVETGVLTMEEAFEALLH